MWSLGAVLAIAALLVLLDVPSLIKGERNKDFWVSWTIMAGVLTIAVCRALGVALPNPLDWMIAVYKPFSDMVWSWLA